MDMQACDIETRQLLGQRVNYYGRPGVGGFFGWLDTLAGMLMFFLGDLETHIK